MDPAARERLLAALDRLEPGMARIERALESLEAANLAKLAAELRAPSPGDARPVATDLSPGRIPDEILEESLLSDLTERAEDSIATCRNAIPADRRIDGDSA